MCLGRMELNWKLLEIGSGGERGGFGARGGWLKCFGAQQG